MRETTLGFVASFALLVACGSEQLEDEVGSSEASITVQGIVEGSETALRTLQTVNDSAALRSVQGISSSVAMAVEQAKPISGYTSLGQLDAAPYTGKKFFAALTQYVGHCGDGITQKPFETCDDGNLNDGDGCPSNCKLSVGPGGSWNGFMSHAGQLVVGQMTFDQRSIVSISGGVSSGSPRYCYAENGLGDHGYMKFNIRDSVLLLSKADGAVVLSSSSGFREGAVGPGMYDVAVTLSHDCPSALTPSLQGEYNVVLSSMPVASRCGDGILDKSFGEECDDGNSVAGDACDPNCRLPPVRCGNNRVDPGEQCDGVGSDGDAPGAVCATDCTFTPFPTKLGTPTLGSYRLAIGSLSSGQMDRIAFSAPVKEGWSTDLGHYADTYALQGHIELDCTSSAVSFVVRRYSPSPYTRGNWPFGVTKPSPGTVEAVLDLARAKRVSGRENVGEWGGALTAQEVRTATADGVCPAKMFSFDPSFCANTVGYGPVRCFWPVLDIQAEEPFSAASQSWKFVIDGFVRRRVKSTSIQPL